jgi:hypothetical protein
MASNISQYSLNIDEAFPVAGVDNESQGFRDNFDLIKTALTVANTEITDLQDTTAKINAANAFSGNQISNADLLTVTEKAVVKGQYQPSPAPTPNIQYLEGSFQVSSIIGDTTYLISWKTGSSTSLGNNRYARMILQVACDDTVSRELDFVVEGGGDVLYDESCPQPLLIGGDPSLIELTTYNNGGEMYVRYLGTVGSTSPTTPLNNLAVTGTATISKLSLDSNEDLAGGDAADLDATTSYFSTSAAETATLAAGAEGQIKVFAMYADSGDMVITVTNAGWKTSGTGTITFDSIGQACTLQYINDKWFCIGNNGATFA